MIEPGRAGAYLALFSEVGIALLVATLAGVGIGYWVDSRLGSAPVVTLGGLFVGMGLGARAVWVLVTRFLARFDE
jgi:ATP synthase protein I